MSETSEQDSSGRYETFRTLRLKLHRLEESSDEDSSKNFALRPSPNFSDPPSYPLTALEMMKDSNIPENVLVEQLSREYNEKELEVMVLECGKDIQKKEHKLKEIEENISARKMTVHFRKLLANIFPKDAAIIFNSLSTKDLELLIEPNMNMIIAKMNEKN